MKENIIKNKNHRISIKTYRTYVIKETIILQKNQWFKKKQMKQMKRKKPFSKMVEKIRIW